jgi:mRNA deadenylase 3'-5' endonuclease subunit Ccr4
MESHPCGSSGPLEHNAWEGKKEIFSNEMGEFNKNISCFQEILHYQSTKPKMVMGLDLYMRV